MKEQILKHKTGIAIVAITLFAFILRAYQFTWQCKMVDELFTAQYITNPVTFIIKNSLAADYNPPTYYLLAKLSSFIHGSIDNFSIRLPALIFGTLAIPAAYLAGKELKNNTLGILAAMVVAIDYPLIYYSQNARPYSLALFCFTVFIYYYIKVYRDSYKFKNMALMGIAAALCMWSHYFCAVPIIAAFAILIIKDHRAAIESGIIAILWIAPMAMMFGIDQFGRRVRSWNTALAINWDRMALCLPNELLCWMWIPLVPLGVYACLKAKDCIIKPLMAIALITPISLVAFTLLTGSLMPRYAVIVAPVFIMIGMYPVADYLDKLTPAKKAALTLLIIFGLFAMNAMSLYSLLTWSWCPAMNMPTPEHGLFF